MVPLLCDLPFSAPARLQSGWCFTKGLFILNSLVRPSATFWQSDITELLNRGVTYLGAHYIQIPLKSGCLEEADHLLELNSRPI